jgi:hypothetical protein
VLCLYQTAASSLTSHTALALLRAPGQAAGLRLRLTAARAVYTMSTVYMTVYSNVIRRVAR